MNSYLDFQPNWISPPGETISDIISEKEIPLEVFASKMDLTLNQVYLILEGKMPLDDDLAFKLTASLGGSKDFWAIREHKYRERLAILERDWLKEFPLRSLIGLGWIKKEQATVQGLLTFFGINSIQDWKNKYSSLPKVASFRKSSVFQEKLGAISAWLNQAERIASSMNKENWDKDKFIQSLSRIRELTNEKSVKIFLPKLEEICASCGVNLVILKTPARCPVNGATMYRDNQHPLLLLSFRYLSDDHFWFTFFHEAGHLILHENSPMLEAKDPREFSEQLELEANEFAEEILIPEKYRKELLHLKLDKYSIVRFARKVGIAPGIVVGQLQFMEVVKYNYFNQLKRRYNWSEIDSSLQI